MANGALPLINIGNLHAVLPFAEATTSIELTKNALQRVGITGDVLSGRPVFIPYRVQAAFAEEMRRVSGESHIGAIVAKSMPYECLGVYADYVLAGQKVEQALLRGIRALRFIFSASQIWLSWDQEHARVQFDSKIQGATGYEQLHEALPFAIIDLLRKFVGEQFAPSWIELDHRRGTRAAELEDLYEAEVRNGSQFPAVVFDVRLLTRKNPLSWRLGNPPVLRDLRELVRNFAPARLSDVVRDAIELQLRTGGNVSLDSIGQQLAIGPRTLQRRLMSESESFRSCLDSVLAGRAKALLHESPLTVSQIAFALGFNEPNSFTRAFRRWTGTSPSDYRRTTTST